MRIEHVALWTDDLDHITRFYTEYFCASVTPRYVNARKGFESQFLSIGEGARIEIMKTTTLSPVQIDPGVERMGLAHVAIAVESEEIVDRLTRRLRQDGYSVVDGPRHTGDGCYESVVLDPDGNRVEITA